ncbi:hypothetical protein A6R68_21896, partial [Neotoma lepida]
MFQIHCDEAGTQHGHAPQAHHGLCWSAILRIVLTLLGCINALVSCALPMWKVTDFISNSIIVAQMVWEGLWMSCVVQSIVQMQCKVYDSLLALPQDLQAAKALCVMALLIVLLGLLAYLAGAKCTTCVEGKNSKSRLVLISGIIFVIPVVLTFIPVYWTAHSIIQNFYNPLVSDVQNLSKEFLLLQQLQLLLEVSANASRAV